MKLGNNNISLIFLSLFLLLSIHGFSQGPFYETYGWESFTWETPETGEPKTILHQKEIMEFAFEGENFVEYYLHHKVEHINHENEIELNNKKYIPFNITSQVVEAKARVIKKDHSAIILNDSSMLQAQDEMTGNFYQYFALEGLELGDIVDVYYVIKRNPNYHGAFVNIQGEYPINEFHFALYAPESLVFDFTLKNDSSQVKHDPSTTTKNRWFADFYNIPKLKPEDNAPYVSHRKHILYKLYKNLASGKTDIASYSAASKNIYYNIYLNLDKSETKSLKKFLKKTDIETSSSLDEKIRVIEDYVKSNISLAESGFTSFDNISQAINNKSASEFGLTKIMANAYKQAGISHQIVVTTDRTKQYFDKEFESFHYLSEYLIYFPDTKAYLCPNKFEYRYKLVPAEFMDNYGLFIKEMVLGDIKAGVGEVKYIEPLPYKKSHHNMDMTISIPVDFSTVKINMTQSSTGYYAYYLQALLNLVSEDIYNEIGDNIRENLMENLEVSQWEFKNTGAVNVDKKPLLFICEGENNHLIDVAGDNYLFKVGELIGPQIELYNKDERQLPAHDTYKREFVRKVVVNIPEGYAVKNPDDLLIKTEYVKNNKQVLLFESTYTLEGNTLTISINEFYDQLFYSLDEYDNYREVVNSASDFNKVMLVIDEK